MDDPKSDEQLVAGAIGGDMTAFRKIVERHEGKVAGVVKGMLGDTPEASDVGQEVFIRLFESLIKFKGDSALSTYIIRIAINLSLNELKRRKRRFSLFSPIETAEHRGYDEKSSDLRDMLHYEIAQLDPEFRAVVTLRIIEGYSIEETAELMNIPIGTVMSRLHRAQRRLKEVITKKESHE